MKRQKRRRINDTAGPGIINGNSDLYRKFSKIFDKMLSYRPLSKSDTDAFNSLYVHDWDVERKLEEIEKAIEDSVYFLVGYAGIGKTTLLRYQYGITLTNNAVYVANKKRLVVGISFDNVSNQINDSESAIEKIIANKLQAAYNKVVSITGETFESLHTLYEREKIHTFISEVKEDILQGVPDKLLREASSELERINIKLDFAENKSAKDYYAVLLKYLATKYKKIIDEIVIIADDIESLPYRAQIEAIRQFLLLHQCLCNMPNGKNYCVQLLICIRPHTCRLLKEEEGKEGVDWYVAIADDNTIYKENPVNLEELFEKRFNYYKDKYIKTGQLVIGEPASWDICHRALMAINQKMPTTQMVRDSGRTFKEVLINLNLMNIRQTMKAYTQVLSNRYWVQENSTPKPAFEINIEDYIFNNVTVIKALGCGNRTCVYSHSSANANVPIPNILYTTKQKSLEIYSLLIINYFLIHLPEENILYGRNQGYIIYEELLSDIKQIFGENGEKYKNFIICIDYLYKIKVLRKSIVEADKVEDLQDGSIQKGDKLKTSSMLYLSPRGRELWKMLSDSSVLLEMYREDVYRDYRENYNEDPGWLLIDKNKKYSDVIFDLMKYIEYIYSQEMALYHATLSQRTENKFFTDFYFDDTNDFLMAQHLINGLVSSVQAAPSLKENSQLKMQLLEQRKRYNRQADNMFT